MTRRPLLSAGVTALALAAVALAPARADDGGVTAIQKRYRKLARELGDSVVGINARSGGGAAPARGRSRVVSRYGAGTIVDAKGHIVTTTAVVPDGTGSITVTFSGGRRADATEVGRDKRNGIVLLKLDGGLTEGAKPATFGSTADLRPGKLVMTVGNPYGSLNTDGAPAFSVGTVSGVYRPRVGRAGSYRGKAIETTAAVNPGSYGGPLVDRQGRVIGIVTDSYSHGRWLGMATPIEQVEMVLDDLRAGREPPRAYLGVSATFEAGKGVLIDDIMDGSPAAKAGLVEGDAILAVDAAKVYDLEDVETAILDLPPGTEVILRLMRGGVEKELPVRLGRATKEFLAQLAPEQTATPIAPAAQPATEQPATGADRGYLGVYLVEEGDAKNGAVIEDVAEGSPAAKAGLKKGDVIVGCDGGKTPNSNELIKHLAKGQAGQSMKLRVSRDGWEREITVTLGRHPEAGGGGESQPPSGSGDQTGFLGVYLVPNPEGKGALVDGAVEGSPAAKAGLKQGDIILGVNGKAVADHEALIAVLRTLKAGQKVDLRASRDGWERELSVTLAARPSENGGGQAQPDPQPAPGGKRKGFVGIALDESEGKLVVAEVVDGSPAAKAGLKVGDVVVGVGGKEISTVDAFVESLQGKFAGDKLALRVEREGWRRDVSITLAPREED